MTRTHPAVTSSDRLLARQWSLYPSAHASRRNLLVHALTVPLFMVGSLALPASLVFGAILLPLGVAAMVAALWAQGRGHAGEATAPAPFRGPADALVRIVAEQWITFPRFVWSGRFAAAYRQGGSR